MQKIQSYDEYVKILALFKEGKARCATNKMFTRDELTALITAEKLYYDEIDGVLWFFVNEGYFYSANFYVPEVTSIRMLRQDMDVLVELTGNRTRYNQQWEDELISAGYEKNDKYYKYERRLDEVIEDIGKQNKAMHTFWERRGFSYRTATKVDYPEMLMLWEEKLGKHRYTLNSMTNEELEEMERYGRCVVICDKKGRICATSMYVKKGTAAHGFHTATYYQGSGLGASSLYECMVHEYQEEGCTKHVGWIRENNVESISMSTRWLELTGIFYQQFVCKADNKEAKL